MGAFARLDKKQNNYYANGEDTSNADLMTKREDLESDVYAN